MRESSEDDITIVMAHISGAIILLGFGGYRLFQAFQRLESGLGGEAIGAALGGAIATIGSVLVVGSWLLYQVFGQGKRVRFGARSAKESWLLRMIHIPHSVLTRALEIALILAVAALVGSVVWGVMTRASGDFVVNYSGGSTTGIWAWLPTGQAQWTEELAKFLLIWVSLLGGAVAFGRHSHLGVDYFVGKLDKSASQWSQMLVHAVVLFFAIAVLVVGGMRVVSNTLAMEQTTPVLGWKMGHVYLALPIAGAFVILYTLDSAFDTLIAIGRGDSVASQTATTEQEGT